MFRNSSLFYKCFWKSWILEFLIKIVIWRENYFKMWKKSLSFYDYKCDNDKLILFIAKLFWQKGNPLYIFRYNEHMKFNLAAIPIFSLVLCNIWQCTDLAFLWHNSCTNNDAMGCEIATFSLSGISTFMQTWKKLLKWNLKNH